MSEFITPPPLEPGDRVAIVAPASGLAARFPHVYERGLDRLRSVFDLEPVEYPTATKDDDFLRANPGQRATDIEDAFQAPDIEGVIATIGGNDQIRMLDYLDADVLRDNPTRFFGCSDNTNLEQYLWNQGIVSYYGGHLLTDFGAPGPLPAYLERGLRSALFEETVGEIWPAPRFTDEDQGWDDPANLAREPEMEPNPGWEWRGGETRVEGRTWGGNLEITYQQLAADRYLPSPGALDGCVLFIETSEELPEVGVVQRLFTAMGERGLLTRFDGFLVGRSKARSHQVTRSSDERAAYRERIRETIATTVTRYNAAAPLVFGVDFGHTTPIVPIPSGSLVTIDPQERTISFQSATRPH